MLRPQSLLLAIAPAVLLAGCASPEARVRTGLINAGLSPPMAGCMAKPMAQKLSVDQLMKLRSLSKVGGMNARKTSYDELAHQIRALRDPQILSVTTSAAVTCALGI
jgi:hypothetical protein